MSKLESMRMSLVSYFVNAADPHVKGTECGPAQAWGTVEPRYKEVGYNRTLLKRRGGGGPKRPPLDISRDYSAMRKALAATLYDFFLSSFPHILTPNLWRPGVRFWSYVTFCTCTSDRKWLQNVILCTKSMQIEFFHIVHICLFLLSMAEMNLFSIIVLQKVSATNFTEKKQKVKKQRNT